MRARSLPLEIPAHPACGTVDTRCPDNSTLSQRGRHSSNITRITYTCARAEAVTCVRAASRNSITWFRLTVGKSSRKESIASPASKQSVRFLTGTRVPAKTGVPFRMSRLETISAAFMFTTVHQLGVRRNCEKKGPGYPLDDRWILHNRSSRASTLQYLATDITIRLMGGSTAEIRSRKGLGYMSMRSCKRTWPNRYLSSPKLVHFSIIPQDLDSCLPWHMLDRKDKATGPSKNLIYTDEPN